MTAPIMWKGGSKALAGLPWLTLSVGAASLLIHFGPLSWVLELQRDRSELDVGALWRMATAHLVHWNADHLFWDLAVFGIAGTAVERRSRRDWFVLGLASAVAVSLAVWVWLPEIRYYRGLSGVDMAFVGFWVCLRMKEAPRRAGRVWGVGLFVLLAKPLFEIATGSTLFVSDLGPGVSNVPLAHLVGLGVGIGLALGRRVARHLAARKRFWALRRGASAGPTNMGVPFVSRLR